MGNIQTAEDIDTDTPPFDFGNPVEVNVLGFPNANEDLQDVLDGQFEFPADDGGGSVYFLPIETNETLKDLIDSSTLGKQTKGKTTNYDTEGGLDKANKVFDDLELSDIKTVSDGRGGTLRIGTLDDGRKVNVREKSTDGRPTLEIQKPNKRKIKFRFND